MHSMMHQRAPPTLHRHSVGAIALPLASLALQFNSTGSASGTELEVLPTLLAPMHRLSHKTADLLAILSSYDCRDSDRCNLKPT